MRYEITSPEGKRFEVNAPDGASQEDVLAYAQQQFKANAYRPIKATDEMSGGEKFLAGVGKGFVDIGRGAGQMLGLVDQKTIDEAKARDAELTNTGAGLAGNILGTVAASAPALFVPGAASIPGAAAVGGAMSALQPVGTDESRLKNTVIGAALGGGAQWGLGKLAGIAANRLALAKQAGAQLASQNSVRDATLAAAREAGYVIPPSQSSAGVVPKLLEGLSGKYKTDQLASIRNQNVTESLARKAVGLAEDAPITKEALQGVRSAAYESGYTPVANAGKVATDKSYSAALSKIADDFGGASASFPGAVKSDVADLVKGLKVSEFDAGDALKMSRILRDNAGAAYAQGNNALGKASKEAAKAIEDQIERALQAAGKDGAAALQGFRDARALIAKAHSVEDALVAESGKVNAKVLGAALQRGKPLSGELKTIGAFANNFKDVAGVPKSGWANPLTVLDYGAGAFGSPLFPAARVGARYAILSGPGQRAIGAPSYAPGLLIQKAPATLEELRRHGLGGLLGAAYAAQ